MRFILCLILGILYNSMNVVIPMSGGGLDASLGYAHVMGIFGQGVNFDF